MCCKKPLELIFITFCCKPYSGHKATPFNLVALSKYSTNIIFHIEHTVLLWGLTLSLSKEIQSEISEAYLVFMKFHCVIESQLNVRHSVFVCLFHCNSPLRWPSEDIDFCRCHVIPVSSTVIKAICSSKLSLHDQQ